MIQHRTVLIVEDSETDRYIFRRYLLADSQVSYTILESTSAAEGLALCRTQLPDGILLDIKLPDLDGFEFLNRLKAQTQGACPPVVVVSCYDDAVTAATAFKHGAEDYFVKGQTVPEEMRSAMRSAIENADLRRKLQQSEERFRTSIENLLDCFGICSTVRDDTGQIIDFRIDYWNRIALESNRLSEDAIGKTLSETFPHYRESGAFAEHCRIVETGEPLIKESFEYSDTVGDQDLARFYDIRSSKLEDGFVSAWRDVTDRVQAQAERDELLHQAQVARTEAETANHSKDEFLAIVAHELRSPLNSIFGWSKLLQSKAPDSATLTRALQSIERSAKNQLQLIEDLLDVSRMVQGNLRIDRVPLSLPLVIEAAIDMVRPLAEVKQIQIESNIDHAANEVLGDPNRLQQVVWNLLTNAIKFTPEQGRVEIALTCRDAHIEICVSDTGKGISAEFLPFVFDRFRQAQTNAPRSQDGLGLGLAISRELVELHEGTITATSRGAEQGATFAVTLPLIDSSPPSLQVQDGLNGLKVLLVDDDFDSLEFVRFVLEDQGAIVAIATSADEAIKQFQAFCPAILVSDIAMPGKDGYMLLREIRGLIPDQSIPAIALTAYLDESVKQQAFAVGYRIHLSKPLDVEQLIEAIVALIR
ncbi:MAG: response regulator [Plectolyngbya sp. WJT66-NPBG17]|jgi:signal transduction histidine kinase/DNA-binding NarL/FixJ family response regulator|nr:response regulator [Plectolyngbya sp. WJT66-NPBG17]